MHLPSKAIAALLPITLLIAACIKVDVVTVDPQPHVETPPDAIRVLGQEPDEPYTVIAIVSVSSSNRGLDALTARMVEEAARLGGDAVLLDTASLQREGSHRQLTGKVIVFRRDTSSVRS
jgi:UDP:flavonoid glycosyltransferase YjiC (YdhE family)